MLRRMCWILQVLCLTSCVTQAINAQTWTDRKPGLKDHSDQSGRRRDEEDKG